MVDKATQFLNKLARSFARGGKRLYLVGGAVRNDLLGHAVVDADLATDADVEAIKKLARRAGDATIYTVGEKFGTIGISASNHIFEITTFRSAELPEGFDCGATPRDLCADLAHRDFTINAMARDLNTGLLHDPLRGRDDLEARLIRGVVVADERFREDPLRLLRAVRQAVQLSFKIEPQTAAAMTALAPLLDKVARERVTSEMNKIMLSPAPGRGVRMLDEVKLLERIIPEMMQMHGMEQGQHHYKDVYEHTLLVLDRTPDDLTTRWAGLLHDIAKPRTYSVQDGEVHFFGHEVIGARMAREILTRLKQPLELVEQVEQLVAQHLRIGLYDESWTDGAVRRFIRESEPVTDKLFELSRADITSQNPRRVAAALARVDVLLGRCQEIMAREEVAKIKSPLDGNELMGLFDRPPGPWIRPLKDHLLNLVLDGQLGPDDKDAATRLAREFIAELDAKS